MVSGGEEARQAEEAVEGLTIINVLRESGMPGSMEDLLDEALVFGDWKKVVDANAVGKNLFCSGDFPEEGHLGVDILHLDADESFPLHTHPGHHLLLVVFGPGTVTFGSVVYDTRVGDLYLVDAEVEHAVSATHVGPHRLLSFGAPHVHVDDPHRMSVIENA